MRKYFLSFIILLIVNNLTANTLDTYITINRFYQIETQQNYVEISYLVPANLVKFSLNNNNKYQAKLKVNISLSKNNNLIC